MTIQGRPVVQRALAGDESRRVNDIGMSSIEREFFCRVRINVRALASASPDRSTGRTAHLDGPTFEAHDDHTGQLLLYKEAL